MSDKCAKKCIFMLVPGALPLKGKLCTLKSVIWEALFIFILSSTSTWYSLSFKSSCHPDLPNRHCSNQSVVGMATARYGVDTTVSLASIFRLPPYVARHYTGTNSCSTMVRITAPPPLSPRLPTLRKPQTSTWRVKRWMKVTPHPLPSPQTATDSHYELECSQSRVMTGVCYTAAPSGHPYKALSIQRSPLSSADKCC